MQRSRVDVDLTDTLCHYTKADVAFDHILPSGKLRLSPYARMRDPLENRELNFTTVLFGSDEDAKEQLQLLHDIEDQIEFFRGQIRLIAFTIDATTGYGKYDRPFMRAWARARMWEQYASDHTGVCIAFDRERTTSELLAHLSQRGSVGSGEVEYSPRGFSDTEAYALDLDDFRDEDDFPDAVVRFVVDHEQELFFRKTLDWQSEHEFRITLTANLGSDADYVFVPYGGAESIRAVILGEQFPTWQIPAAKWVCERRGVPLLQMQWLGGQPEPGPPVEWLLGDG
jgi:DUF2971 family protein